MSRLSEGFEFRMVKAQVIVRLSCGCRTKLRVLPFPRARFGCTSGLGHGYSLHWTEADINGSVTLNKLPKQREGEK